MSGEFDDVVSVEVTVIHDDGTRSMSSLDVPGALVLLLNERGHLREQTFPWRGRSAKKLIAYIDECAAADQEWWATVRQRVVASGTKR